MSETFFFIVLHCMSLFSVGFFKKIHHDYNKNQQTPHANH